MESWRVGVIGGGLMGSGIAEVCARSGVDVTVLEADDTGVARAQAAIERSLDRGVKAGKLDAADREAATDRLAFTTSFTDVEGSDAAIEAVFEDEELKRRVFKKLDEALPDAAFLASNTSSVPIMKLGAETTHPGRVVGLHFFNPVPVLPLVELVTNPVAYHDKPVQVVGFVTLEFERNSICPHPDAEPASCLWLDLDGVSDPGFRTGAALIEATFDGEGRGHFGLYAGTLRAITRFEEWR